MRRVGYCSVERARRIAVFLVIGFYVAGGVVSANDVQVLLFTRTEGFRHQSIADGEAMVASIAADEGLLLTTTEDSATFTSIGLAPYSVVVWLSTTGDVLSAGQQSAFETWVEEGGGWVGIHAAADCEYDWLWYGSLLGGDAWFESHPRIQEARVIVDDFSHPATDTLSAEFVFEEEWYNFQKNPRPTSRVMLRLDEKSYDPGPDAMGDDHPIAWWHTVGEGRSFYTGLGHRSETYAAVEFREQVRAALLWAAGLLRCEYAERSEISGETVDGLATFGACSELLIRDSRVVGPGGHAILRAANEVAFEDGFEVWNGGLLTVETGRSLYSQPLQEQRVTTVVVVPQ